MPQQLLITFIVICCAANLPAVTSLVRFGPRTWAAFWKLTPHQYFFAVFCVPAAALFEICALWDLSSIADSLELAGDIPPGLAAISDLRILLLVAVATSVLTCFGFYISTLWSPDKLRDPLALKALRALASMGVGSLQGPTAKRREVLRPNRESASSAEAENIIRDQDGEQFLRIVLSKEKQRSLGLLHRGALLTSGVQAFVIISLGVLALQACLFMLVVGGAATSSVRLSVSVDEARLATLLALVFFLPYPFLFGAYRSDLEPFIERGGTGSQELVSTLPFLLGLGFLNFSYSNVGPTPVDNIKVLAAAAAAIAAPISSKLTHQGWVKALIGTRSSFASQTVSALFVLILVGTTSPDAARR